MGRDFEPDEFEARQSTFLNASQPESVQSERRRSNFVILSQEMSAHFEIRPFVELYFIVMELHLPLVFIQSTACACLFILF